MADRPQSKSDAALKQDVLDELQWEPQVDHAHIGVAVTDGIVTLSGHVSSFAHKLAAEKAVRRVEGVRGIAEEIEVRLPSDPKTADPEIAKRIVDMLDWSVTVPRGAINVRVEDGWVTLTGDVDYHFNREAASTIASRISGVKGVSNLIEVRKSVDADAIRERIVAALRRSADLDASTITVVTEGDTVKLSGKVHAWYERKIAERAAWSAPGVNRIEDNIVVI